MGIEIQSLRLLLRARRMGVDFSKTLTIGRQDLIATPEQVADVFARFGETIDPADAARIAGDRFSNALFARLGAGTIDAMDISDFEGATVIHDLNQPLPCEAGGRFSLVFDGGTLEHVFASQTALATYMALPKVGGHLIVAVPSNNECGHGFYQFSPEFFFRTLTPANGYAIEGVYLVPMFVDADWLAVRDPAEVGGRVGHNASRRSTYIFVVAKRVSDVAPFARMPQQSDYVADWEAGTARESGPYRPRRSLAARVAGMLPAGVVETLLQLRAARARPDPRLLTRFVPERG